MTGSEEARSTAVAPARLAGWSRLVIVAVLMVLGSCGGCASLRVTDPPRTATEQFLLSGAAAKAVGQLNFSPLRGRSLYVDTTYFAASEQQFVLGELRARLLLSGVNLVPTRDDAQVVMEVRSGGVGIDRADFLLGLPSVVVSAEPNQNALNIPFVLPEVALLKNIEQWGIASVAFVAYWRETGEVVASSGPYIGWTTRDDWWIMGYGPRTGGNIPTIATPEPTALDQITPANAQPQEAAGISPETDEASSGTGDGALPDHAPGTR